MNSPSHVEITTNFQAELVGELIALQQTAFPPRMQFRDPEHYYCEGLSNPQNVNVICRTSEGAITGYLLAIPQDIVCAELRPWDPAMPENPKNLYIDLIQTLPGRRQVAGLKSLLGGLCREAQQRGFDFLSAHVRTTTGLSSVIQRIMLDCIFLRRLDNWYDSGEGFDYLESKSQLRTRRT